MPIKVDFPAPLSPRRAWISPRRSVMFTSARAMVAPYDFAIPRAVTRSSAIEPLPSSPASSRNYAAPTTECQQSNCRVLRDDSSMSTVGSRVVDTG
jgi:hypothetical protein